MIQGFRKREVNPKREEHKTPKTKGEDYTRHKRVKEMDYSLGISTRRTNFSFCIENRKIIIMLMSKKNYTIPEKVINALNLRKTIYNTHNVINKSVSHVLLFFKTWKYIFKVLMVPNQFFIYFIYKIQLFIILVMVLE